MLYGHLLQDLSNQCLINWVRGDEKNIKAGKTGTWDLYWALAFSSIISIAGVVDGSKVCTFGCALTFDHFHIAAVNTNGSSATDASVSGIGIGT